MTQRIAIAFVFGIAGLRVEAASKIYWTATNVQGETGRIRRADLDGSNVEDVLITPLGWALRDITVDTFNQQMFWIECPVVPGPCRIRRAGLDGSNIETFSEERGAHTFEIASDQVYYDDGQTIRRGNLDGSDPTQLVLSEAPGFLVSGVAIDPGTNVPAVSTWSMIALALLICAMGAAIIRVGRYPAHSRAPAAE